MPNEETTTKPQEAATSGDSSRVGQVIYWEMFDALDMMPPEIEKIMVSAIYRFSRYGSEPDFGDNEPLKWAWAMIGSRLARDIEKASCTSSKRKEAGKKGGRKPKQEAEKANAFQDYGEKANAFQDDGEKANAFSCTQEKANAFQEEIAKANKANAFSNDPFPGEPGYNAERKKKEALQKLANSAN